MKPGGIVGQVVISTEDDEKSAVSQLVADLCDRRFVGRAFPSNPEFPNRSFLTIAEFE
jgi:hypothetical protein